MKTIVIVVAAAMTVAAGKPAPAVAQEARTARAAYADLRLEREGDVRRLDRRIGRAAEAACGWVSDWNLRGRNEARRCRAETRASVAAERERVIERARRMAAR